MVTICPSSLKKTKLFINVWTNISVSFHDITKYEEHHQIHISTAYQNYLHWSRALWENESVVQPFSQPWDLEWKSRPLHLVSNSTVQECVSPNQDWNNWFMKVQTPANIQCISYNKLTLLLLSSLNLIHSVSNCCVFFQTNNLQEHTTCFLFVCLFVFFVPQPYLWGSPLLGEIFAYVTVF